MQSCTVVPEAEEDGRVGNRAELTLELEEEGIRASSRQMGSHSGHILTVARVSSGHKPEYNKKLHWLHL